MTRPTLPHRPTAARTASLLALLLLGAAGCRRGAGELADANVVATVNGEHLARADFERELARELSGGEGAARTPEQVEPFKRALLDTLVERALLLQAARSASITVGDAEVDRELLRLASDYPGGNLTTALAEQQLTLAELKTRTAAQLTVERLIATQVYARVAVTEEELRAWWAAHEDDFVEPEQVRASQIVVKDADDARRVQAQLQQGEPFAELAKRYSLSADARVGGDLGFFPRGVMPPKFDEVAFKLGVGQVSDVVATEYGYHLFRVTDRKAGRRRTLVEARGEAEKRLLEEKRLAAQAAFVQDLRQRGQVWVNEPVLQALRVEPRAAAAARQE